MPESDVPDAVSGDAFPPTDAHGLTDPCFLLFFIPLTTPLRIAHDSTFTFFREEVVEWLAGIGMRATPDTPPLTGDDNNVGRNFVSLKIWRPKYRQHGLTQPFDNAMAALREATGYHGGDEPRTGDGPSPGDPAMEEIAHTVIEAVTPLIPTDAGGGDLAVSLAFDRCVEEINTLIAAFILASGDPKIERISRQNLFPFVAWAARDLNGKLVGGPGMYLPGTSIGTAFAIDNGMETVDRVVMQRVGTYLSRIKRGDPFANYLEWARAGRRELDIIGDTAAAVNAVHTAGEILLDTILYMIGWEGGESYEDVARWFDGVGFKTRLKTHYHGQLGGQWNPDDPTTVIGKWAENVSRLRGRVVHAGYRPTESETGLALDTLGELEEFVKARLADRRLTYKRTALLLLGTPGLDKRGLYSGQIKRFVEQEADNEDDWIVSYKKWLKV